MQRRVTFLWGGLLAFLLPLASAQTAHDQAVLVVRGARILPITAPPLAKGVLVIQGGKIIAIGEEDNVTIPAGAKIEDASGKIIMPGIVDSHSHIGIEGNPTVSDGPDANQSSGPVQPSLRGTERDGRSGTDESGPGGRSGTDESGPMEMRCPG